jgi:hypothetical protein
VAPSFSEPLHQPGAGIPAGTDEMYVFRHLLSHGASWRRIKLQGMLVPVVVRDGNDGFDLVAGFHRIAAAKTLGLTDVPVVVRDVDSEDADRAVENITSCRRRHDVINADLVVMPSSR